MCSRAHPGRISLVSNAGTDTQPPKRARDAQVCPRAAARTPWINIARAHRVGKVRRTTHTALSTERSGGGVRPYVRFPRPFADAIHDTSARGPAVRAHSVLQHY